MSKKRAGYAISVVSDLYNIHPQTLRSYEREGLLKPSRTQGNTRLYSEEDIERLELILTLTRELGVNLAGVEVILNMREKMERMHNEVEQLMEYIHAQFDLDADFFQGHMKEALIRVPPSKLSRVVLGKGRTTKARSLSE